MTAQGFSLCLCHIEFVKYSEKSQCWDNCFKILVLGQVQEMLQMAHFLYLVSETQNIQVFKEERNIFVFQNGLCFCTFQHILKHSVCTDRHHCSHFFSWPEVPVVRLHVTDFLFAKEALSILCVSLQASFTSRPHLAVIWAWTTEVTYQSCTHSSINYLLCIIFWKEPR